MKHTLQSLSGFSDNLHTHTHTNTPFWKQVDFHFDLSQYVSIKVSTVTVSHLKGVLHTLHCEADLILFLFICFFCSSPQSHKSRTVSYFLYRWLITVRAWDKSIVVHPVSTCPSSFNNTPTKLSTYIQREDVGNKEANTHTHTLHSTVVTVKGLITFSACYHYVLCIAVSTSRTALCCVSWPQSLQTLIAFLRSQCNKSVFLSFLAVAASKCEAISLDSSMKIKLCGFKKKNILGVVLHLLPPFLYGSQWCEENI